MITAAVILIGVPAALLYAVIAMHNTIRKILRALNPAWLWFTGLPLDGHARTNATWLRAVPRPPAGPAQLRSRRLVASHAPAVPRRDPHRAPPPRPRSPCTGSPSPPRSPSPPCSRPRPSCSPPRCGTASTVVRNWRHERHYVKPLERTLADAIGAPPVSIEIERLDDDGEVGGDRVGAGHRARRGAEAGGPRRRDHPPRARGPRRRVEAQGPQPVRGVHPERAAPAARRMGRTSPPPSRPPRPNELVFGIGKRGAIVKAKYSESPHLVHPRRVRRRQIEPGRVPAAPGDDARQPDLQPGPEVDQPPVAAGPPERHQRPRHPRPAPGAVLARGRSCCAAPRPPTTPPGGTGRVRGNVGARIIVLRRGAELRHAGPEGPLAGDPRPRRSPKQSPAIAAPVRAVLRGPGVRHPRVADRPAADRRVDRGQGLHHPHQRRDQGDGPLGPPGLGHGGRQARPDAAAVTPSPAGYS